MLHLQHHRRHHCWGSNSLHRIAALIILSITAAGAQTPAPAKRVLGSVESITATEMTVKTDSGTSAKVLIDPNTAFVRVPPGETDLRKGEKTAATGIAVGDRVLAQWRATADPATAPATRIVAMSKTAIAQRQETERAEWQRRGIAGTVTALDPAKKELTVTLRGIGAARVMFVDASGVRSYRRYAPDSVRFSDAKPSTFGELEVGDQVRVLGDRNEDGTQMKAEQVVAGRFRNIAGTVVSVDAAANEVRITDLETKKPLVVKLTADSQVKRMPPVMAQFIAMRRGGAAAGPGAGAGPGAAGGPPGQGGGPGGRAGGGDPQQMLERMPAMAVTELKPGDALIIASSAGSDPTKVNAFALIAGVEPLLSAPREANEPAIGGWNLNIDIAP